MIRHRRINVNPNEQIRLLKECEQAHLSLFTTFIDYGKYAVYTDNQIANMYSHNFTYIKSGLSADEVFSLVEALREENKEKPFLSVLFAPDYDLDWERFKAFGFDVFFLLYMAAKPDDVNISVLNQSCIVKIAADEKTLYDGIICDIKGDEADYSFLYNYNMRKKSALAKNPDKSFLFVVYVDGIPAGKCEVFINDGILRIESLLVEKSYRNKGVASSIVYKVKEFAIQHGIAMIYLMADESDTPKQMYAKMGFQTLGRESWLFRKNG